MVYNLPDRFETDNFPRGMIYKPLDQLRADRIPQGTVHKTSDRLEIDNIPRDKKCNHYRKRWPLLASPLSLLDKICKS